MTATADGRDDLHRLSDGRRLGYAEYGDGEGLPVVHFTGGNNSRLEAASYHEVALDLGLRILSVDRPGMGLSSFQPGRTFRDWPADVASLVDALGLDRFALLGLSGGGPHVLAVMSSMPERVRAAVVVSSPAPLSAAGVFDGMWPPIRMLYFLARRSPAWMMRSVMAAMTDPDRNFTDKNIGRMRAPETEILRRRPELVEDLSVSMKEAHRQGHDGAVQEWRLYTRPWGFPLDGIRGHVDLWYGQDDGNAPPGMGRALHQMLPNSTLHLVSGEAHLSLMNNRLEDILLATRSG